MKRICAALLVMILLCLSLASCGKEIDKAAAVAKAEAFLEALSHDDYAAAEACMHPDLIANLIDEAGSVAAGIARVERQLYLDFSAGLSIKEHTGYVVKTTRDMSMCDIQIDMWIGSGVLAATVSVKESAAGMGVIAFFVRK